MGGYEVRAATRLPERFPLEQDELSRRTWPA